MFSQPKQFSQKHLSVKRYFSQLKFNLPILVSHRQKDVKLISFIGLAETQLDIAIFSLTHSGIADAIVKAKSKPNMKIRMIVDREQAVAESSKVPYLKAAGIDIRIGFAKSMTHNKFTIVDLKRLETGSYNYTFNATNNNLENQVYLSEESTVKRFSAEFERMWGEASVE
jgi:phosphatidylserine/phosphatidylglycerophosphate/cardiolipin synthase-like enzyme